MQEEYQKIIKEWIERISEKRTEIDGFSICPYAKTIKNISLESVEDLDNLQVLPVDYDIKFFVIEKNISESDLSKICVKLNYQYSELIFLPDHKDADNYIKNLSTGNGRLNLILCQPKKDLEIARANLLKSSYYDNWNREYLKKILEYGYGNLD